MASVSNTEWVRTPVKGHIIVSFVKDTISPNWIKVSLAIARLRLILGKYRMCWETGII
jgi:hypothetical protein